MTLEQYMLDEKIKEYKIQSEDINSIINEKLGKVLAIDVGRSLKIKDGKAELKKRPTIAKYINDNREKSINLSNAVHRS